MGDHGGGRGVTRQGLLVEIVFENGFNTLVRTRPDAESPPTGGFEAALAIAFPQPHDAQTGAEALLRMRPGGENGFDDPGGGLARFGRPEHEPLGRPFGILLVGLGHMRGHRAVAPLEGGPLMAGHPGALVEDFHDLSTQAYFELLLDQR